MQSEIIRFLTEELPQTGDQINQKYREWSESRDNRLPKFNKNMTAFLEQCVLSDIEKVISLIQGLFIMREYLNMNGLNQIELENEE